jgi:hypothetical protein
MERIDTLDWGAYATFAEVAKALPLLVGFMQIAHYVSSYVSVGLLGGLAICLFLRQGRRRDALITLLAFVSAALLIELMHFIVPRHRPPDAQNWLGTHAIHDSYPAAGVFLFTLAMILLVAAVWRGLSPAARSLYIALASLLTVWVCMSQFILALHFVSDVIGGLAGAALVGWVACRLMAHAQPALALSPEPSAAIQDLSRSHGIQK